MTARSTTATTLPSGASRRRHLPWGKLAIAALVIAGIAAFFYFTDLDWKEVPAFLQGVSKPIALLIMATLPLIGFPISAVYLAAGAIFGPWMGLLVVTGATASHLVLMQLLSRSVLKGPIERLRKKWSHKIPEVPATERATLVAMIVIVPGPPYFARNCLLALSEVPWRLLFAVALPLYVVRSAATIFLGDLGNNPSTGALIVLGTIYAAKLTATYFLFKRLKGSLHRRKARAAA